MQDNLEKTWIYTPSVSFYKIKKKVRSLDYNCAHTKTGDMIFVCLEIYSSIDLKEQWKAVFYGGTNTYSRMQELQD